MVSPTQAVPEVPVVWGNDVKRAIVCRRYTIMVAQIMVAQKKPFGYGKFRMLTQKPPHT